MNEKRARKLNREYGKKGSKLITKAEEIAKDKARLPKNTNHSSKKRHKDESLQEFRKRRKEANKRKRERIKRRKQDVK